jgi:hypothetical protein
MWRENCSTIKSVRRRDGSAQLFSRSAAAERQLLMVEFARFLIEYKNNEYDTLV